jgi:hypothetical protein
MDEALSRLEQRVVAAAEDALARQQYVAPVDVLAGIGWVPFSLIDSWRQGRVADLEAVAAVGPDRLASALEILRRWAQRNGLTAEEVAYVAATRDRRPLQFTAGEDPATERAYRTHWVSASLSPAKRERLTQRQSQPPDLVVIDALREWTCTECGGTGSFLFMEGEGPLCLTCADLDHLVFLPRGDAALTRRAREESGLSAVVVRFSRARRRSPGCFAAVRRRERRPSPGMRRPGAAVGWAARRRGVRQARTRSCWQWSLRCAMRTRGTTSC